MSTDSSGIRVTRVPREDTAAQTSAVASPVGRVATGGAPATDDPRTTSSPLRSLRDDRETKPFFLTSEFLLTAALMLALLVAGYLRDDTLTTWRTWLLVTVVGTAYVLSRGIAKAGSPDRR